MISRRGLLGAFLAAPVIIRTPGLLMPVKPARATGILRIPELLRPGVRQWKGRYAELTGQWEVAREGIALTSASHPVNMALAESLTQSQAIAGLRGLAEMDVDYDSVMERQRLLREMHRLEDEVRVAMGRQR